MQIFMSYFHFIAPDTWNGFRDIDEKINFEELNRQLEENEGTAIADGAAEDMGLLMPPLQGSPASKKDTVK